MRRDEKSGISLISLVITIVVMIIIASTIIVNITGESSSIQGSYEADFYTTLRLLESRIKEKYLLGSHIAIKDKDYAGKSLAENPGEIKGITFGKDWYELATEEDFRKLDMSNVKFGPYYVNYKTGEVLSVPGLTIDGVVVHSRNFDFASKGLIYELAWDNADKYGFDNSSGLKDNKIVFDGIDDAVEKKINAFYENGITMEITIKLNGAVSNSDVQNLMMKRTNTKDGFFMFLGNNEEYTYGKIYVDFGGTPNRWDTGILVSEGVKTHITYVYDPEAETEKGTLYINGEKKATTTKGGIQLANIPDDSIPLRYGIDRYGSVNGGARKVYPFNGEIYMARLYNKALTAEQVKGNYEKSK